MVELQSFKDYDSYASFILRRQRLAAYRPIKLVSEVVMQPAD